MVSIKLNSKRQRLEDPAEIASSSTNPCNKNEVQSPTTPDPMVGVSGSKNQERDQLFGNDLKQVRLDDVKLKPTIAKFVSGLGALASSIQVEAIHVKRSSFVYETKLQSFNLLANAMTKKCNDNAVLKIGWYGASKEEIIDIITNGFIPSSYRHGVQFSAYDYPLDCLQTAIQDKDGLRHILICQVIVGKIEVVTPGSGQFQPSSEDLDSGVDNLLSPRKYTVWSCHLNTQILPLGIISFRVSPRSS
ncbi:hypothetical protein H5410_013307 [Solanum commersonii]|uniref:PARP catalytic domain-containing protein n=1 Tax=Solanum commersonii TaxID=4109 RepID=A0A9J6AUR7_SOLCO|nr:hypothetical protein H5410_013307 [Solanum commersonii]